MKKIFKPLHLLAALALLLAYAWPAAAESVQGNVYGETPVVADINVTAKFAEKEAAIQFQKNLSNGETPEYFEVAVLKDGTDVSGSPFKINAGSVSGDTVTYTVKNLEAGKAYSITVLAKKGTDGTVVGLGNAFGGTIPPAPPKTVEPPKLKGTKAAAGKKQVTVSFDKLADKKVTTYQIHWWSKKDKKGNPIFEKPIEVKASDVKKSSFSYSFKGLKAGTTYHFNIIALDAKKQTVGLTMDLTATAKK